MIYVSVVMIVFSIIGAIDRIIGNRFGVGEEFEKGIMVTGSLVISMVGILVVAPFIADVLNPVMNFVSSYTPIDASIIPSLVFANDMGAAPLAKEFATDAQIGYFNGLVVSSMMGAVICFVIPFALTVVKKEKHNFVLVGILSGIVTIPIGCFFAGLIAKIPIKDLLINLIPLIVFSAIVSWGLMTFPQVCVKIFMFFGKLINVIITIGLVLGIIRFLTGVEIIKGLTTYEEAGLIVLNATAVLTGAFPMVFILSKMLSKALKYMGEKMKINEVSAMGILSTLAANITTMNNMNDMDDKGIVINAAFAVSAGAVFADHMAFTLAYNHEFLWSVIAGKLISGIAAIFVAVFLYKRIYEKNK